MKSIRYATSRNMREERLRILGRDESITESIKGTAVRDSESNVRPPQRNKRENSQ
jgi:hypothetical protein